MLYGCSHEINAWEVLRNVFGKIVLSMCLLLLLKTLMP